MSYPGYVYQKFPKHVHKAGGAYKVVMTEDELAAALADGWALRPVTESDPAPVDAPLGEDNLPATVPTAPDLTLTIDASEIIAKFKKGKKAKA